jgi:hypothetical protein
MTCRGGKVVLQLQELKLALDGSELSVFSTANSFSEKEPPTPLAIGLLRLSQTQG